MSITDLSIKRPTLVVVLFTVLAILGLISYSGLGYKLLPSFDQPVISVVTAYPGASAEEVEDNVTREMEDALSALEGVEKISSTSSEGVSVINVELALKTNIDLAMQDAQRRIDAISATLPEEVSSPSMNKFSSDDMPILQMGVSADLPARELYDLIDQRVGPQLTRIEGVGQLQTIGGEQRQIQVKVDQTALDRYGLSILQVQSAIKNANLEMPSGKIEASSSQYSVRLAGKITSLEELNQVVLLRNPDGSEVLLSDIAQVVDGSEDLTTLTRINRAPTVGMSIYKTTDANSVEVSEQVRTTLTELEAEYAGMGLDFDVTNDDSVYTLAAADAVVFDLGFAIVLVALVMLLFLHSMRNAVIVMVSVPASIISVFVPMYLLGFSLNLMTLMALSMVVGILVDDSIVVLENIYRHMEMRKNRKQAALDGRNEIGFTALAITLVDVVVFLPIVFVDSMISNVLQEFALVVVFSTLMSLIVSFTLTPLLASRFAKHTELTGKGPWKAFLRWFEKQFEGLKDLYERILTASLKRRWVVYVTVVALLAGAVALVPMGLVETAFVKNGDRGEFSLQIESDPTNTLAQTNAIAYQVEDLILAHPEVLKVNSKIGYSSTGGFMSTGSAPVHKAEMTVTILPEGERDITVEDFAQAMEIEVMQIPGIKVKSGVVGITGSSNSTPLQVRLNGSDKDELFAVAEEVKTVMAGIPGVGKAELSVDDPRPELNLKLDREQMENLGVNVATVGATLRMAYAGDTDTKFTDKGTNYDINVQLADFNRNEASDILTLTVTNNQGKLVEIGQFASVSQELGPTQLERRDRIASIGVNGTVVGRTAGDVGKDLEKALTQVDFRGDVTYSMEGSVEQQTEAFSSLFLALGLGILFMYLIMVALYNSYITPLVVLFSIPLAIIGALLALALTREPLTLFALLGMIMLIGLVGKNAILLVDFANARKKEGLPTFQALVAAGRERLRPIMMTTIAMVVGMMPIALASGAGAEIKNGMAWVIIGGLTSSLFLTLVMVPAVFMTIEDFIAWFKSKIGRNKTTEPVAEGTPALAPV